MDTKASQAGVLMDNKTYEAAEYEFSLTKPYFQNFKRYNREQSLNRPQTWL